MKTIYCFYICVYILLLSRDSNGGLVKGFLSSIHDTAHKVHDDIRNVFHPKEEPKRDSVAVSEVPDKNKSDENIFVFATTPAAVAKKETNKEVKVDNSFKPNDSADSDDSKLFFASTPTTERVVNVTTTMEKDGKENFAGGCQTGYERTADGRCKPTF